jgi:uncharacterized protein
MRVPLYYWHKNIFKYPYKNLLFLVNLSSLKGPLVIGNRYKRMITPTKNGELKIKTINENEKRVLIRKLLEYRLIVSDRGDRTRIDLYEGNKRLTVWVHTTKICNFRCSYCYIDKTIPSLSLSHDLAIKKIAELAISAKKNGYKEVNFNFAGGEPLLRLKEILYLVQKIKTRGKKDKIKYLFSLTTNASLLTEQVAARLKENGFLIDISFDGSTQAQNSGRIFSNGQNAFNSIIKGIDVAYRFNILKALLVTVTSHNVIYIPSFMRDLLFKYKNIHINLNLYKNTSKQVNTLTPNIKDTISFFKKMYRNVYSSVFLNGGVNPRKLITFDAVQLYHPTQYHCGAGRHFITLDCDGTYKICPMIDRPFTSNGKDDILSTLTQQTKDIFYGYDKIRDTSSCNTCMYQYICKGGCRIQRYYSYNKTRVPHMYCKLYKELIPELIRLDCKYILMRSLMERRDNILI